MNKLTHALLLLLLSVLRTYGQDQQIGPQLDSLFTKEFKPTTPGCEVLVAKDGKGIYHKAFGSANLELNVPVTADMVFKLASVTKQFTAIAVLQLLEKGKISLQDSLQKFIPDYPSKGHAITIRQLLTHTSGIRDYMQIDYPALYMERWDFSPKQLIDSFKYFPLEFEPGTKYSYSNSGYYLLGYIIEKVSGRSYQNYVQENIIQPLGLQHTYFDMDGIIIPNRVNGYRKEGTVFKNADYWSPTIAYAAGGLLSNTQDLLKWFNALLAGQVIRKETLEEAFTPFKLKNGSPVNYGYGWYIQNQDGIQSIEHGGKMNGFITNEIYYPEQKIFIAILLNCEDAPRDELSVRISEIVLGRHLQTDTQLDENVLNTYIGTYSLNNNASRTITLVKEKDKLVLKIPGQSNFELLFQTATRFQLKNMKDMSGEFIRENGVVTKMIVHQNGLFEWKKIK